MEAPMEKLITELKEGLGVGGPCSTLKGYILLDSLVSMLQEVNEHQKTFIQQNYVSHADHENGMLDFGAKIFSEINGVSEEKSVGFVKNFYDHTLTDKN